MNFTIYKSEKARWFLNSIIIVLTYYVVAKIGFLSSFNETNACPIWFSSGFAIAIIALLGYKYIPSIFLASLLANFFQFQITGLPVGQSLMLAMIIGVANASEGFVGAYFWRKFKPLTQIFESPSYVIQFIGLVVFIPAFVSSVIGVAGLLIGRVIHFSELPGIWLIWTSGNIVGTLIFAPFVSIGKTIFKFRGPFDIIHKLKHTFYWLIVIVISWLTISGKANEFAQTNIELKYIILLLLVWQIIRYKQIGGFVFIIIISLISVFYTLNEVGVFVGQTDKDSFLVLQSFLGMMAIFTLFLSSAFKSNIKTLGLIKESEEKYKALYDNAPDMHVSVDPNTAEILQCNHTLINKLGYSKSEIIGQPIFKMYHPDCMDDVKKAFQSFVETGEVNNAELQLRRKDGSIIEVSLNVSAVRDEIGNIIYSRSAWREITDQKLAEEVLIRSEERYKGIVQSTASCIAVYEALDDGEDFVFIDFNPKAEEVEQISKNDLIGKKVTDVFPGVTEFGLFKVFQNVWKTGSPEHLPVSVYEDDRIQGYRENYVYKLSTGEIVAVYQDLTKGKQAEEALKESELRFKALHNSSFGGITIHDKGLILECNQGLADMSGYSVEELIGMDGLLLIEELAREEVMKNILAGYEKPYESIGQRKNGELYPLRLEAKVIPYKGKDVWVVEFRDITEAREAEKKLIESEKNLQDMVDNLLDGVAIVDENGKHIYINPRFCQITGYTPDELLNMTGWDFSRPEDRDMLNQRMKRRMSGKFVKNQYERIIIKKDGTEVPVEMSTTVTYWQGKKRPLAIIHDITQRKLAEKELIKHRKHLEELVEERTSELQGKTKNLEDSQKSLAYLLEDVNLSRAELDKTNSKLEIANKELEAFAYSVSHDLKAPLRAISQLSYWISEDYADKLDDEGKEQLALLGGRVKRMDTLIEGILQYSRVGKAREKEELVNLNDLVIEIIESLGAPDNIEILVESTLPGILCDQTRMVQVFQNLISNAIKFMDKENGIIKIACSDEGDNWKFSVEDNGPGIEEKYFDRVFQIFQTLKPRDKLEGTGLGLALVKKIVNIYQGDIWMESNVGRGTKVIFSLPKRDGEIIPTDT